MAKVRVQTRVGPDVKAALLEIMETTGLKESELIEELIIQGLSEQKSELATTFLMPKLDALVDAAMEKHVGRLAKLQARAALNASTNTQILLGLYGLLNPKADENTLRQVHQGARKLAYDSLMRQNKEVEALLSALAPQPAAADGTT
ncbi:hypothetical protein [Deinococcus aquaedulcis]|uniref:hypothetical protein n=1 Tax=Deinococcus aquaedulcis TaxID=2840455 RepID=UPI001C8291CD|nr:hypothetical protein [Deinococcus aquaedulcis]